MSRWIGIGAGLVAVAALVVALVALVGEDSEESSAQVAGVSDSGGAVGSKAAVGLRDDSGIETVTPVTPSVETLEGEMEDGVRTYNLTASEFTQKISNFPIKTATVWGYNESTPGPTLVATEGETIRVNIKNELPMTDKKGSMPPGPKPTATTIHFHGLHQPNDQDGVAGISQPEPIKSGETFTYEIKPEHAGSFAYHSHTDTAIQDLRGLDGMIVVQPTSVDPEEMVDQDFVMTLQQFAPVNDEGKPVEAELVSPFPPGTGSFPFSTINGKTGEASGQGLEIREGDRVRIRFYNASNIEHSMHLHGHDFVVTSKNGHPVPESAQSEETTQNISPGDFYEIEFVADNPGNWIFHCHVPHHTSNAKLSGYNGGPVGMTRVFHYKDYEPIPKEYFKYDGS